MAHNVLRVGQRVIDVSNEDKVFFPADGITKLDIVLYYREIARKMVHLARDHPLVMQRFPDGIGGEGFFQKNASDYFPDWLQKVSIEKQGGEVNHVILHDAATLVYLADQACLTPHIWLSRKGKLNFPDRLMFDLDPGDKFEEARRIARKLRDFLDGLGLESFVMTTGSKGVHVVVPLDERSDFDTVRAFARDVAEVIASGDREHVTTEQRINKRQGRIYIDTLRNAYAQTAVAPYAVRAKPGAPVATPVEWREIERGKLLPTQFTIKNIFQRLRKKDPWARFSRHAYSLKNARRRLDDQFANITRG